MFKNIIEITTNLHGVEVIQAIKVDELVFKFTKKKGVYMKLDLGSIGEIVDFGPDVNWQIQDSVELHIKSPKYIGYQLGRLRNKDNGVSLVRATETNFNNFVWTPLNHFDYRCVTYAGYKQCYRVNKKKNLVFDLKQENLSEVKKIKKQLETNARKVLK